MINQQINLKPYIRNLLAILKTKILDFDVIDNQGQLVGRVKDLILDSNSRLHLVVSQLQETPESAINERPLILRNQDILKIDTVSKCVLLNVATSAIEYMPEDFWMLALI